MPSPARWRVMAIPTWRRSNGISAMPAPRTCSLDIAPDLTRDPNYIRADRPMRLGARYAIRLSVAYNGTWIRYGRSFERDGR